MAYYKKESQEIHGSLSHTALKVSYLKSSTMVPCTCQWCQFLSCSAVKCSPEKLRSTCMGRGEQLNANGLLHSYYLHSHWLLSFGMCDSKSLLPERFSKELLKTLKFLKDLAKFEVWLKWIYQLCFRNWNCHFPVVVFMSYQDRDRSKLDFRIHIAKSKTPE